MATTFASFSVTVAWDLAGFVGCLFAFNVLRRSQYTKKIYAPKRYVDHPKYMRPKQLPDTYFLGWVRPLFSFTEEDIIKTAGYDAAVYLRLFSFGIRLFVVLSLFNLLIVLPVNLTDERVDILERLEAGQLTKEELMEIRENDPTAVNDTQFEATDFGDAESVSYKIGSFDKLSMANIKPGSNRLWAHLLSVWFITLYTLKLLWKYHHDAMDLRIRFLATTENGAEAHTVLVTDVPGLRFGSPLDRLMRSVLFKYLPKRLRARVESSIELLFSVATQGISQVNQISTQLAQTVGDQLQQTTRRASLRKTKNRALLGNVCRRDSMNVRIAEAGTKWVNPCDVTDMDPVTWVTSQLANGARLEEIVFKQFRDVYPNGLVKCANVIYDTTTLEKLFSDYNKITEKLEDLIDHYVSKLNEGIIDVDIIKKRIVPLLEGSWAVEAFGSKPLEVDLLEYFVLKLQSLKIRMTEERFAMTQWHVPAAFVTFRSRWAQTIAATAFHHHFPTFWNAQAAPHPEELIWENLKLRGWERTVRLLAAWISFTCLCLFFIVPVTFVQGLIQMDRLERYPVIGSIVTFPLINGILKAVVPNLALKLFLAFLPSLLKHMNRAQGMISLSEIDFGVVRKYFVFQTITVFFFSFIASSLLTQIQEIRDNPSSIRDILGVAAPQSATFFISYILYTGLLEGGISFLNLVNLIQLWLMGRFAGTERAKARIWKHQTMEYGVEVPNHTLTILLGLAFSVVNPIVLPVTLAYFLAMKLTWTYNMLYIYSEEYQSGGKLWEHIFEHVIGGLVVMQSMMIGLFAIKRFPYSALLIPLPFLTLFFRILVHHLYDKPLRILSLRAAHDLDVADRQEEIEGEREEERDEMDKYRHPAFQLDWNEMQELVNDTNKLMSALKSLNGKFTKREYLPASRA